MLACMQWTAQTLRIHTLYMLTCVCLLPLPCLLQAARLLQGRPNMPVPAAGLAGLLQRAGDLMVDLRGETSVQSNPIHPGAV